MHKLVMSLILSTFIVLSGQTALADPPRPNHHLWQNSVFHGHYVLYDSATRTWVETIDCRPVFRFTLVSDGLNELVLFDASRGMTVKLTYEGMSLKASGESTFSFYQRGAFDRREMFEHEDGNGAYTGTIARYHGCSWAEWFPGGSAPAFRFGQIVVDGGAVEIYDGTRDIYVRLDASHMWLRQGTAPYGFFKNGKWR